MSNKTPNKKNRIDLFMPQRYKKSEESHKKITPINQKCNKNVPIWGCFLKKALK
jgi:hypothetical protein